MWALAQHTRAEFTLTQQEWDAIRIKERTNAILSILSTDVSVYVCICGCVCVCVSISLFLYLVCLCVCLCVCMWDCVRACLGTSLCSEERATPRGRAPDMTLPMGRRAPVVLPE